MTKRTVALASPTSSLTTHFSSLTDPRVARTQLHALMDIITIAVLAVICGAEGWEECSEFGKSKKEWLKTFLALDNGIPCSDTFRRVFGALDPAQFQTCFRNWVQGLVTTLEGKVVAVDGKTLRGSFDTVAGQSPLHLVHAWAAESGLLLGQQATAEKSNEMSF